MSPNLSGSATGLFLAEAEVINDPKLQQIPQAIPITKKPTPTTGPKYEWNIVWRNLLAFLYLHVGSLYGFYLVFTSASFNTFLFALVYGSVGAFGITAGAHRLWAHKAYKARWPLRVILAVCQTLSFQNHIYEWVRDHRVHHKFTDTDADPHNSKRGFFFSHIGWLMVKKHEDVKIKGKVVDMSDLEKDWVVIFQKRFYPVIMPILCFLLPTWVPIYFWNEAPWNAWYIAAILRYTLTLNFTWLVNSAAHIWGTKPYDKTISPVENLTVGILAFGEGWHNYHHAFPWDYKTSEYSGYRTNFTTAVIDFFAKIGWAYNLKTAPLEMVIKRAGRTGDGSRKWDSSMMETSSHQHKDEIWGWDDRDMKAEDKLMAEILNKKDDED